MLEEQLLDTSVHDRSSFSCGVPALDDFFARMAAQQVQKGVTVVYVVVDTDEPRQVLGFYTLSAAQVDVLQLSPQARRKLPRYPVPCIRLGRLAVNITAQGSGIGKLLVGLAVERCIEARAKIAAYAILVDAKDESAKTFYEHYGFIACMDAPLTLYLPLGK